jgi:hypothetical protein
MIAAYVAVALIFGGSIGYYSSSKKSEATKVEIRVPPKKWTQQEHVDTMLMCRSMCNKSVKSYDPLTGECQCKN